VQPFPVFIAFVGGDDHNGACVPALAHGLKHMAGSHDIGGEGFDWYIIGEANQGLGSHVENHVWSKCGHDRFQSFAICEIATVIGGASAKADDLDQILKLAETTYGKEVTQAEVGTQLKKHWQIQPPENCTACHR
jgi:hypothetical protein